ncbi:Frizzled-8 [Schistosoma japonicum]|nr:Frizzled-8 [Schistosoma japonicum]
MNNGNNNNVHVYMDLMLFYRHVHVDITVADIKDCSMPCYTPYYSYDSSHNFTTFWLAIWSILCAISTILTIFTFITDSYRFQYPELPLIYLSACYFMISIGYLIRIFMGHEAVACDSLPNEYEMIQYDITQSTTNSNHNSSNNWFDFNKNDINNKFKSVTYLPSTLTTMTLKTGDVTTMMMDSTKVSTSTIVTNLMKSTNQLIRSKLLRYALTGRASCAAVFFMAASVWWVVLALTWLLAAGLKWGSEAISKYSQFVYFSLVASGYVFHFIAWSLPASQTALALLLSVVEGDPISGLCTIQSNKSISLILFTFCPLVIYLSIGIILMIIGFIALFRIRGTIKLQRPRLVETYKLDKLIIRIGIFGMLYTIPNIIILFTIGYELRNTNLWQLGIACHCHYDIGYDNYNMHELEPILPIALPVWNPPKPLYAIFMLKHFMSLIIGITSGFWIWSNKTIESWRRFCFNRKCLLKFHKYNSSSGLLVNTNGIDHDNLHKQHIEQWRRIPLNVSNQTNSALTNTHMKSMLNYIDNNEYCRNVALKQSNSTSYDLINNNNNNNNNNQLVNLNVSTPSTLFSTHSYDVPIHDRNKSSIPQIISNNNNNNNSSSISTRFSSNGISSVQPNDGLTRTASMLTDSELNSNYISPKLMDHYFNGEQRNYEVIGSQKTASTTTTTIATTTNAIVPSGSKYDLNNDLRRDNHSIGANQFISHMIHENRKK